MALQYAVLHHTGVASEHYDLLVELAPDAPLWTWRAASWPIKGPQNVTRLPDHRRMYLSYEGPVSGGRGSVRRVCGGECRILDRTPSHLNVALQIDDDHAVQVDLTHLDADAWEILAKPSGRTAGIATSSRPRG